MSRAGDVRDAATDAAAAEARVRELEAQLAARTRELEEAHARLVAQDRLVTLGRLVAAIAHELNNPVGAIAAFAGTLRELSAPVVGAHATLAAAIADPRARAQARALLDLALEAAHRTPPDTRTRRERTGALERALAERGAAEPATIAERLARMGLTDSELAPLADVLQAHGDVVTALAERRFAFERGLEVVSRSSADVARIVDGLRTYSYLDRGEAVVADVHEGIEAALAVLSPRMPAGVEVVTRFGPVPPFPHRPGELTQVWTNLVDNALHAMGGTGTLTIETDATDALVRVTVTDTGPGLPDAIRERVFDPHVTTRGPGAGQGLGLPICRTVVERHHGGALSVESRPGHTAFTVLLPRAGAPQDPDPAA